MSEQTMIERVARAIAMGEGEDYMEDHTRFDRSARSALTAMREPTEVMKVVLDDLFETRGASSDARRKLGNADRRGAGGGSAMKKYPYRKDLSSTEVADLVEAMAPIFNAVEINDGDTLASLAEDETIIWRASGSWTGYTDITLGDLRRIYAILQPAPGCPKCWPGDCKCEKSALAEE